MDFTRAFTIENKVEELCYLLAMIAVGAIIYFIFAFVMSVEETRYFSH